MNGDGLADLPATHIGDASIGYPDQMHIYFGSSDVLASVPPSITTVPSHDLRVRASGDLNLDGYGDVGISMFHIAPPLFNNAYQELRSSGLPGMFQLSNALGPASIPVDDIDGDGFTDRVQLTSTTLTRVIGGTRFAEIRSLQPPLDCATTFDRVAAVGDVNGDGFADFAVACPATDDTVILHVYLGDPFLLDQRRSVTVRDGTAQLHVASAGDVNGDGYADVLLSLGAGRTRVVTGSAWTLNVGALLPVRERVWPVGDVDADGYFDLLAVGDGAAALLRGSAHGSMEPRVLEHDLPWRVDQMVRALGDVNGDGFDDISVGAPISADVVVLYGSVRPLATSVRLVADRPLRLGISGL
jgi:hypothetical protein